MKHLPLLLFVPLVGLTAGCGRGPAVLWQCNFHEANGFAELETDKAIFVFEGVPLSLSPGQSGGGTGSSLQVGGGGTTSMKLTALDKVLTNTYSAGVNTIVLDDYTIRVIDNGQRVQIGDQTFPLTDTRQTFIVKADGSAELQQP